MISRRDKLLIRPWEQRRYEYHRHKVQSALPAIDVGPPPDRVHVSIKLKKQQKESERCDKIEKDNLKLLRRLRDLMSTSRVDNNWTTAQPNFLNRVKLYSAGSNKLSYKTHDSSPVFVDKSRRGRCLACTPKKPHELKIPEERVPWDPPKLPVSRRIQKEEHPKNLQSPLIPSPEPEIAAEATRSGKDSWGPSKFPPMHRRHSFVSTPLENFLENPQTAVEFSSPADFTATESSRSKTAPVFTERKTGAKPRGRSLSAPKLRGEAPEFFSEELLLAKLPEKAIKLNEMVSGENSEWKIQKQGKFRRRSPSAPCLRGRDADGPPGDLSVELEAEISREPILAEKIPGAQKHQKLRHGNLSAPTFSNENPRKASRNLQSAGEFEFSQGPKLTQPISLSRNGAKKVAAQKGRSKIRYNKSKPSREDLEAPSIVLSRGEMQLAVSFPPDTLVKLREGAIERFLPGGPCKCKAIRS